MYGCSVYIYSAIRAKVVRGMKDPILRLGGGVASCLLCSYCAIVTNAIFYVHHRAHQQ